MTRDLVLDIPGMVEMASAVMTLHPGDIIATGTPAQVEQEIKRVVKSSPRQMILGADCTVEADTNWDRLRHAISVAHSVAA